MRRGLVLGFLGLLISLPSCTKDAGPDGADFGDDPSPFGDGDGDGAGDGDGDGDGSTDTAGDGDGDGDGDGAGDGDGDGAGDGDGDGDGGCVEGTLGCPCLDGWCEGTLECVDGICQMPGGDGDGDGDGDGAGDGDGDGDGVPATGFTDCEDGFCDHPDETQCIQDDLETVFVCSAPCVTTLDCPPIPAGGNPWLSCEDVTGDLQNDCVLLCDFGETCPNGMFCFNDFLCVW